MSEDAAKLLKDLDKQIRNSVQELIDLLDLLDRKKLSPESKAMLKLNFYILMSTFDVERETAEELAAMYETLLEKS